MKGGKIHDQLSNYQLLKKDLVLIAIRNIPVVVVIFPTRNVGKTIKILG
jgi:hypothetical protein